MAGAWLRDPRRLRATFLVAMALLVAALGGLAWKLLDLDQQLAASQRVIRGQAAADVLAAALQRELTGLEQQLGETVDEGGPPPQSLTDAVVVRFDSGSVEVTPPGRLAYLPNVGVRTAADGEALALASTGLRQQKHPDEALDAYGRLAAFGSAPVAGMPAALLARLGRLRTFEIQADQSAATAEARALADDLAAGRFPIGYGTYKYLAGEARAHLGSDWHAPPGEPLADGVTWLWDRWRAERSDIGTGWAGVPESGDPVFAVWRATGDQLDALVGGEEFAAQALLPELRAIAGDRGVDVTLLPPADRPAWAPSDERTWVRSAVETGLPWTVQVTAVSGDDDDFVSRRRLLVVTLGILSAFVLAGTWLVGRGVTRELEAARLKADFVAAVSHEFRTPLTTLCQLSELLKRERVATDDDRRAYYDLLHRESERLRRLVEGILSFGRFDRGRAELRLAPTDVAACVRSCVEDFRASRDVTRHPIEIVESGTTSPVPADADALRSVFWNLVENSVRYSPQGGAVRVEVRSSRDRVEVSIQDTGVGIPRRELTRIFEPFVRGSAAGAHQIRGTGIGLALAREIVRAHGGDLTVSSDPGRGSTFTAWLPAGSSEGDS